MQGKKTLPHFFLGADVALVLGLVAVLTGAAVDFAVAAAVGLLVAADLRVVLAGALAAAGPGVTTGGPLATEEDVGAALESSAREVAAVGVGAGAAAGVGADVGSGVVGGADAAGGADEEL